MKWIFLKTVSFEIGAWLTGGFTFLLWSVRSKHRTVDHKNETITVDFWGPQLLMFFHRGYGVSTNCCNYRMVISQRHLTKTFTGLQNKTKHPTTENKRITEIVGSHKIILLWSVMNMVCYESGLFWIVCYEWSVMNESVLNGNHFEAWLCFYESRLSNCLLKFCNWVQRKIPSYWRWWWQLHMLQQFWPQK